jgi:uncharacterized protein (TIGR02996 family)
MSDDAAFLVAIKAAPNDNTTRLAYADWLDEQGRPGGEFLRIDCEIAALDPVEFEQREQLRAKLRDEGVVDSTTPDIFDSYFWQRAHLVAKLRCATRDLDQDWMAAVSRVPIEEILARVREIQSWLRRRVAVAEVPSGAIRWERESSPPPPKGLWQRIRGLFTRTRKPDPGLGIEVSPEWAKENMQPGDELWEYDTGGESWAHLCGEMGYAVVRRGKVVEFVMLAMN